MRILIVIAHHFRPDTGPDWYHGLGSGRDPLARIAALNCAIVALHRYFGARQHAVDEAMLPVRTAATLDIVIVTTRDGNLLQWVGLDPGSYEVEHFDGPPMMLGFEAQRIMRERLGAYDCCGYMEDDLIIEDPAFFEKLTWFANELGAENLLMPVRYEMAYSGTPAKVVIAAKITNTQLRPFRRSDQRHTLVGRWNGREQSFALARNPHSGGFFLTQAQLRLWVDRPSFYDRDVSWIDPLASAATLGVGKVFDIYMATTPDPWFLAIEHYGTRYAAMAAPPGHVYGEPPLLAIAQNAMRAAASSSAGLDAALGPLAGLTVKASTINALTAETSALRHQLDSLRRSRSKLAQALMAAIWRKLVGRV